MWESAACRGGRPGDDHQEDGRGQGRAEDPGPGQPGPHEVGIPSHQHRPAAVVGHEGVGGLRGVAGPVAALAQGDQRDGLTGHWPCDQARVLIRGRGRDQESVGEGIEDPGRGVPGVGGAVAPDAGGPLGIRDRRRRWEPRQPLEGRFLQDHLQLVEGLLAAGAGQDQEVAAAGPGQVPEKRHPPVPATVVAGQAPPGAGPEREAGTRPDPDPGSGRQGGGGGLGSSDQLLGKHLDALEATAIGQQGGQPPEVPGRRHHVGGGPEPRGPLLGQRRVAGLVAVGQ